MMRSEKPPPPLALRALAAAAVLLLCAGSGVARQVRAQSQDRDARWAILMAGISGEAELQASYIETLKLMHGALAGSLRFPREHILVLCDDPAKAADLAARTGTREGFAQACREVAGKAGKDSVVLVFLLGHGSSAGEEYKLNLVGPDPTAEDLARVIDAIPAGTLVIVNATSASGASLRALSGERRVVITATKSGSERNLAQMGRYFVEALRDNAADADKNLRVSMLEAFLFAQRRVQEHYAREGSLQTEHMLLDDNGDGTGHESPSPANGDGLLARTTDLSPRSPAAAASGEEALAREAEAIQKEIEGLKYSKDRMTEAEYQKRLEDLLVRLAQNRAKRQKQ